MYYDLHIHSCLSPCGNDEMTVNNICNMAAIKELELIAITDHNSTLNCEPFSKVAKQLNLKVLFGAEVQTIEEVHVLAYFNTLDKVKNFQLWLDENIIKTKNNASYFGNQYILNENDEVINECENLLLMSVNADVEKTVDVIHEYGGKVVLAHAVDRANGICTQLGFIPENLNFDGIEVKTEEQKAKILMLHPWIKETFWFKNSDAHQLIDISEKENYISEEDLNRFLGGD